VTLAYADGCPALISGHRAGYKTLLITVDGGHLRVGFPAQLNLICGLLVSDFGAPAAPPPGSTSPLNVLAVTVTMPATLAAGMTASYSVTLHNTSGRRLTLSPCPSYTQYLAVLTGNTQAVAVQQYFYLNCAAARQVPARGSVTFAMCIPVPAASGRAKYDWQLQDTNVATAGMVTVRRPWPPSISGYGSSSGGQPVLQSVTGRLWLLVWADYALRVDGEFVAADGAEQPVLVPLLRWSSPAQVALPAVLLPARRFVPSAGRRDKERTRSAGQQVIVAASPVVQPNGMGHMRR